MIELWISANGEALTVNGNSWSDAPLTEELCNIVGRHDLVDGGSVIVDGKPISKFRYFENLGIAILESIPGGRLWRVAVYLKLPPKTRRRASQYKSYGYARQRSPKAKYCGQLTINGKQIQAPLRLAAFPKNGELQFIQRGASGPKISAFVSVVPSGFVEYVMFEFKRNTE